MNTNLTEAQNDYAIFLPALSGFYATFVGKQRFDQYVEADRIPSNFNNGIELAIQPKRNILSVFLFAYLCKKESCSLMSM